MASVELDTSLKGLGGRWNEQVYKYSLNNAFPDYTIVHPEMLNLVVAIRTWGNYWANQKVVLQCDNQAVVSLITNGKTRDRTLAAIARNIHMEAATRNISLITIHIKVRDNKIADLLSSWETTDKNSHKLKLLLPRFIFITINPDKVAIDWSI